MKHVYCILLILSIMFIILIPKKNEKETYPCIRINAECNDYILKGYKTNYVNGFYTTNFIFSFGEKFQASYYKEGELLLTYDISNEVVTAVHLTDLGRELCRKGELQTNTNFSPFMKTSAPCIMQ